MSAEPVPSEARREAMRQRLIVIDDFLPAELAEAMRLDIDNHFANPGAHAPPTHQVWNYWFVPELYTYLRTQPEKVIAFERADAFVGALRGWALDTLGMGDITWPFLSLYVAGCRQGLHNDSVNGRFAFVYSLTRDERQTIGGETLVFHEGDPFRGKLDRPAAGRGFYDSVPPRFNRLVIFDDRMPHGVERVDGSMDPREGRFVLHGHISETGPVVVGALAIDAVMPRAVAALEAEIGRQGERLERYHGPLVVRAEIAADGGVAEAYAMVDRVFAPEDEGQGWPAFVDSLLDGLAAVRFPAASGPTSLVLPLLFGRGLRGSREASIKPPPPPAGLG